jgi:hypothetical protein
MHVMGLHNEQRVATFSFLNDFIEVVRTDDRFLRFHLITDKLQSGHHRRRFGVGDVGRSALFFGEVQLTAGDVSEVSLLRATDGRSSRPIVFRALRVQVGRVRFTARYAMDHRLEQLRKHLTGDI